ncbi:putative mannan endo-1,4-beta-mannosidase [Dioscorea sansibarensis]
MALLQSRNSQKWSFYRPLSGHKPVVVGQRGWCLVVLGILSCVVFIYISIGYIGFHPELPKMDFVRINGTQFMLDGKPFYVNGWNSYWLMDQAVEDFSWPRVLEMFQIGENMGLSVCRSWAFNDGAYHALQVSLGRFNERVFKALDRVIVEARRHGIRLLLSLVNNLDAFGGKSQYVRWAWEEGISLTSSNDSFFFDPSIRSYFKVYLKTILTRKNHLTGIEYRDDPAIFAWELINEPECRSDATGDTLQDWLEEMAAYVKSIDKKHLLTIGLEGFYGPASPPERLSMNPSEYYGRTGADFIRNSKISDIDFTSVHIYPDQWLKKANFTEKMKYISKWVRTHIEDCDTELKKPVLFTEFGLSSDHKDYDPAQRHIFYKSIYDAIHNSAKNNGAGAGALIWQFLARGMDKYNDDFGIFPDARQPMYKLIKQQSCRIAAVNYKQNILKTPYNDICPKN